MNNCIAVITGMAFLAGPVMAESMPEEEEQPMGVYEQGGDVGCRAEQGQGFMAALTNIATCATATLVDVKLQKEINRHTDAGQMPTDDDYAEKLDETESSDTAEYSSGDEDDYADYDDVSQPERDARREARQRENRNARQERTRTANARDYRRTGDGGRRDVRDRRQDRSGRDTRSNGRQRDLRNRSSDGDARVARRDMRK